MTKKQKQITVRVPLSLLKKAEKRAKEEGRKLAGLVRWALERYLA